MPQLTTGGAMKVITESLIARKQKYLLKVNKLGNGCWHFGNTKNHRYGYISYKRQIFLAHRVFYAIYKSDPKNFLVCHSCDYPPCVNPDHLFLGTYKENTNDMIKKGRKFKPKPFESSTVVSEDIFLALKDKYESENISVAQLSRIFKINTGTVYYVFRSNGVKIRPYVCIKIGDLEKEKICDLYINKNLSMRKIAKIFGYDKSSVSRVLKSRNITSKSDLEQKRDAMGK